MRDIINISLPKRLNRELDKIIKRKKYSTKSEFLRELIREKLEEEDLRESIKRSEAEFRAGKGKLLKSLDDLA